ncbi:putative metal dependent hydrolase [Alkaliphilus metalliredigens QYMF]|uniref:Putative metal dependent hydrolase n=1 Tax=Alkaliphilus metalliredigens (strain QYMF) TaxID=293826 RepID=A6TMR0_ALKMQ|nr:MBL fold metallo-hydrolase [Alkaliphilus metalliredigens]ABR47478.1 putative metal dependent hydrolase [Alkaliphilus metalliredigens QYMF]
MLLSKGQCRFHYLYNSGFIIETENNVIIIDYYQESPLITKELFTHKNIFVFVTHNHGDHFNPLIYDLSQEHDIQYIIHKDVPSASGSKILSVVPDQHYSVGDLSIETFGSTDSGVSYLISVDGLTVFHSGDLNWWKWKGKSQEIHKQEEADYKREIYKLRNKKIDIAFVPVDPRLEEYYDLAVKYFGSTIDVQTIVPMHFRDSLEPIQQLAHHWKDNGFSSQFVAITRRNQSFYFDEERALDFNKGQ